MSGPAPYGFRRAGDALVVEPAEAEVRRKLVEWFLRTRRVKTVARLANEAGFRTRGGSPFTDTTVRRLLWDPEASGTIVPQETWQRCRAILEDREKGDGLPGRQPVHLFSGKLSCRCGGAMQVRAGSSAVRFVCSRCRARIGSDLLEKILVPNLERVEFEAAEVLAAVGDDRGAAAILARMVGGKSIPLSAVWPLLEPRERVELVDRLVAFIVVSKEEIAIELAIPSDFAIDRATAQGNTLPNNPSLNG